MKSLRPPTIMSVGARSQGKRSGYGNGHNHTQILFHLSKFCLGLYKNNRCFSYSKSIVANDMRDARVCIGRNIVKIVPFYKYCF